MTTSITYIARDLLMACPIHLDGANLAMFKNWLQLFSDNRFRATLHSIIDHETNSIQSHVLIDWTPLNRVTETYPVHFQDLQRTVVPLAGDIRTLTPEMVHGWRMTITEHALARKNALTQDRPPRINEERHQILRKATDIIHNLKINTPHTARWQKWYSINTTPQINSVISEGYNLIVNLRPHNGYRQITQECRIDNT